MPARVATPSPPLAPSAAALRGGEGSPAPAADGGDAALSPHGRGFLLRAFMASFPAEASSPFLRDTFEEVALGGAGGGPAGAGPGAGSGAARGATPANGGRVAELYSHPLLESLALLYGALATLRAQAAGVLPAGAAWHPGFSPHPLPALAARLEKRLEQLFNDYAANFWAAAARADRGEDVDLHTLDTLMLTICLAANLAFAHIVLNNSAVARAGAQRVAAVWRRAGVPGERGVGRPVRTLDDFLIREHWIGAYGVAVNFDLVVAASTLSRPVIDPVNEFPTLPVGLPMSLLACVPPPSRRTADDRIPPELLAADAVRPTSGGFFRWLDPCADPPLDRAARASALAFTVGNIKRDGTHNVSKILSLAIVKVAEYAAWLRTEAGLSMTDVLVADAILAPGAPPFPDDLLPSDYRPRLLSNPHLPEAIRRRAFLLDAHHAFTSALPPDVAAAASSASVRAMALAVPVPRAMQLIVHGHFSRARLWLILLNAPELFPGGGTCLASDAAADPLAGAWMRTPSFRTALRAAMLAARSARELSAEFTPAELGNSMLFFHAGFAACYAAYLMLAVLQRFRAMVSAAPLSDRARALELHSRIVGDVSACLDLLDGSRQPETQAVRVLLRSMLEGDEVRLGRAEVQMLVMARREEAARGCEHAGRGSEGHCWVCAAHRGDEHAGAGGSPLFGSIASASVSSGSKAGRRVRFAEEVEVCETYSAEEYPARSGLHVEEEEREVQELSLGVVLGEWGVTGPAVGPGMPNLLDYR